MCIFVQGFKCPNCIEINALGAKHTVPAKTVASISNSNVQKIQRESSCLHIPVLFHFI